MMGPGRITAGAFLPGNSVINLAAWSFCAGKSRWGAVNYCVRLLVLGLSVGFIPYYEQA